MIGERLKKIRTERKIKQEELAEILGVKKTSISMYETGKNDPTDKIKIEIARYFNISLDYLIGVIDEPVPYYNREKFIMLPSGLSLDEKKHINYFFNLVEQQCGNQFE